MREETIRRKIKQWAKYIGVKEPEVFINLNRTIRTEEGFIGGRFIAPRRIEIYSPYRMELPDHSFTSAGEIKIFDTREVIKHEFIHYLRYVKRQEWLVSPMQDREKKLSYDEWMEYVSQDKDLIYGDEEHRTRQMVARSWKNIKHWFYDLKLCTDTLLTK